jgi:hypothetical protein
MKYITILILLIFATLAIALTPVRAIIDCGTLSGYGSVEIELPNKEFRVVKINCGVSA